MLTEDNVEKTIDELSMYYNYQIVYRRSVITSVIALSISLLNIAMHDAIEKTDGFKNKEVNLFFISNSLSSILQLELIKTFDVFVIRVIANHFKNRQHLKTPKVTLPSALQTIAIITLPSLLAYACLNSHEGIKPCLTVASAVLSFILTIKPVTKNQEEVVATIKETIDGSFSEKYHGKWEEKNRGIIRQLTYIPHKKVRKKYSLDKLAKYLDAYVDKHLLSHIRVLSTPKQLIFIIHPSPTKLTSPIVSLRDYLKDRSAKKSTISKMPKPLPQRTLIKPEIKNPSIAIPRKPAPQEPPTPVKKVHPKRRRMPFANELFHQCTTNDPILKKLRTLPNNIIVEISTVKGETYITSTLSKKQLKPLLPNGLHIQSNQHGQWKVTYNKLSIPIRFKQPIKAEEKLVAIKRAESVAPIQRPKPTFTPSTLPRQVELLQMALIGITNKNFSYHFTTFLTKHHITKLNNALTLLYTITQTKCCEAAIAGGALRSLALNQTPRDFDFICEDQSLITTQSISDELHTRTSKNPKKKMCFISFLGEQHEMSHIPDSKSPNGLDFTINGLVYNGKNIHQRHPNTVQDLETKTLRLVHTTTLLDHPEYKELVKKITHESGIDKVLTTTEAHQYIITILLNPKLLMRATIRILQDDFRPTKPLHSVLTLASQHLYEALPMEAELSFWIYYFERHMTTFTQPHMQVRFMQAESTRGFFLAIIKKPDAKENFIEHTRQPESVLYLFNLLLKAKAMLSLTFKTPVLLMIIARLSLLTELRPDLDLAERVKNRGIQLFPEYLTWSKQECSTLLELSPTCSHRLLN